MFHEPLPKQFRPLLISASIADENVVLAHARIALYRYIASASLLERGDTSSTLHGTLFTTFEHAAWHPRIPQRLHANRRAVISPRNPVLQIAEVRVPAIAAGRILVPGLEGVRVRHEGYEFGLLLGRQVYERRSVAREGFPIEESEAFEETLLGVMRLDGQHLVDKAVGQRRLGARRIGGGDEDFAEDHERLVLVVVQKQRLPIGARQVLRGVVIGRKLERRGGAARNGRGGGSQESLAE